MLSCAHGRKIVFTDGSEDEKIGWVCVPVATDEWNCVSLETFTKYLKDAKAADM